MISQKQIFKLAKQIYPASMYSRFERKQLRQTIAAEMLEYSEEHPDATYNILKQQFCDNDLITNQHELSSQNILKIVIIVGIPLVLICVIGYFVSNNWTPVSYTF